MLVPERSADRSRGPCMTNGVGAQTGCATGEQGAGLSRSTGTGSTGVVLACTEWTGVAGADVQSGFAGACAVVIIPGYPIGASALGSMNAAGIGSDFGITRAGSGRMLLPGAGSSRSDCGGVLGRNSLTLGTGPIDVSVSVAQSSGIG